MLELLLGAALAATVSTAKVYDAVPVEGVVSGKPYYEIQATTESKGDLETVTMVTRDRAGEVYSRQEVRYLKGAVSAYTFENSKAQFRIDVADGQVKYDSVLEGKKSDGKHVLPSNFVIGASLRRYIDAHYEDLASGKELEVQMGLPVFGRTLGFLLRKVEGQEKSVVAGERIKVELKPSSLIVRAMMPAAHYFLDTKSKRLVRYVGPTEYVKPGEKKGFIGTVDFH